MQHSRGVLYFSLVLPMARNIVSLQLPEAPLCLEVRSILGGFALYLLLAVAVASHTSGFCLLEISHTLILRTEAVLLKQCTCLRAS